MIKFSPDTDAAEAPVPLTMAMRALLRKLTVTRMSLSGTYGGGYFIRKDGVVLFWVPTCVRDEALRLGFLDERGRINAAGRAAIRHSHNL